MMLMTLKRFELYLFLTTVVWIAIVLVLMWARLPNIAAKTIAISFLRGGANSILPVVMVFEESAFAIKHYSVKFPLK